MNYISTWLYFVGFQGLCMFKWDRQVYLSHEVYSCLCLSVYIPSTSFVPLQQHTLIKPPRMNLFYYWILCAGEYPKCVWVPSRFMRWCSSAWNSTGENNVMVIFNKRPQCVAPFPLRLHSLQRGLTEDGFTYYRACACQWARPGESITPWEECEGHTNARSSQVTNEAVEVSGERVSASLLLYKLLDSY